MVLHLLGKKSWNVYNADNVERVRRDEAEAKAREEAAEQRMQEEDAARRIAILRGEDPPPPPRIAVAADAAAASSRTADPERSGQPGRSHAYDGQQPRKRRRLRGEDDTDREIRYAREDAEAGHAASRTLVKRAELDAPLHDHAGHIQLLPPPDESSTRKAEKNADAEAEKARKRQREEDQFTMRFSNAAGFKNGMERPWYASSRTPAANPGTTTASDSSVVTLSDVQDKNVWGNEDPLRKERERSRISTNDPFAAMQQAQRQLKQSEADRELHRKKRLAEVEDLKRSEERARRHQGKHRGRTEDDDNSLEDFSLDAPPASQKHERTDHDRSRRRHHHRRHRSRSRSRGRHR